jgi:hypothetical protein
MKKYLLYLLPILLFTGCEKTDNTIIDPPIVKYQVIGISSFPSVLYNVEDSTVVFHLTVNNSSVVGSISVEITNPDGVRITGSPFTLFDDGKAEHGDAIAGDNRYSNRVVFSRSMPNGRYEANYYMTDLNNNRAKVAVHNFAYDNGAANVPPVISNLTAPDTIVVIDQLSFLITLEVFDANGAEDISSVYFIVTRPDGTSNNTRVPMNDRGEVGDVTAGDGIYSTGVQITAAQAKGNYSFRFEARDRRGEVSNPIIHIITVQ